MDLDYIKKGNANKSNHFSAKYKLIEGIKMNNNQKNEFGNTEQWHRAMGQGEEAVHLSQRHLPSQNPDHNGYFLPHSPADSILTNSRKSSVDSTASTIRYEFEPSNAQGLLPPIYQIGQQHGLGMTPNQQQMMANVNVQPVNEGNYGQVAIGANNFANKNSVNFSSIDAPYYDATYTTFYQPYFLQPPQLQYPNYPSKIVAPAVPAMTMTSSIPAANQPAPSGIAPGNHQIAIPMPISPSPPINSTSSMNTNTIPSSTAAGNAQIGLDEDYETKKMLKEIREFIKSPIMDFICEILVDPSRKHICSFIGPREFHIHQPNTFAKLLHLTKSPFKEEKSYLKIARAMKIFELRSKNGQVVMRKVPEKRNQYKFYPDMA